MQSHLITGFFNIVRRGNLRNLSAARSPATWCRPKSGAAERDPDIVFRWTDANNFWLVRVTSAGQAVELAEMGGGVYTVHVSQN